VSSAGEDRKLLEHLEALVAHPGYIALMEAIARKRESAHVVLIHAATEATRRESAAAEYRAFTEVMTLAQRTMARLENDTAGGEA
jgi:hypothetical protein